MVTGDSLSAAERDRLNAAIARAIGDRRRKRGMTREEVYARAGLARATYDRIEKGTTLPDVGRLEAIAYALDTTEVGIINEAKRSLEQMTPPVTGAETDDETSSRAARIYGRMLGLE